MYFLHVELNIVHVHILCALDHRYKKRFLFRARFYVFNVFYFANVFVFKNIHWKYHLKSLSKQRKQIGSVWLFFFVPMLEFPYRPIYWKKYTDKHCYLLAPPLQNRKYISDVNMPIVKQNDGMWVEKHQLFYSTFTNVFYFCHVFLNFLTFFIFPGTFFTSMH